MSRDGITQPCQAEAVHRVPAEVGRFTQSRDERPFAVRRQRCQASVSPLIHSASGLAGGAICRQLLSRVDETRQVRSRHSAQHSRTATPSSFYSTMIFWLHHSFCFCPSTLLHPPSSQLGSHAGQAAFPALPSFTGYLPCLRTSSNTCITVLLSVKSHRSLSVFPSLIHRATSSAWYCIPRPSVSGIGQS